ncbi:hypothetical protein Tco_0076846, partial [Tanacetum coccineum]
NWKIIKLGKKGVYQIVRENGTDKIYISFGAMLKDISRDDLTELYRLVLQRYGTNGPEDEYYDGVEKDCLSVGFATTKQMVISSPCLTDIKNCIATPEQTATGKEISNLLIADSLLKPIRLSMHLVIAMKH